MEIRELGTKEEKLVRCLLTKINSDLKISKRVEQLNDGNMGTIRFTHENSPSDRKYQKDLIQVSYVDKDRVTVLITLTMDNYDNLYELEFWKTDFTQLNEYPKPDDISFSV